jgi:hypothetical protein
MTEATLKPEVEDISRYGDTATDPAGDPKPGSRWTSPR